MLKTAVITGAGSGVGRATALLLARNGWRCVILGRRESTLKETATLAGKLAAQLIPLVCDISDPTAVERMGRFAHEQLGDVEVLVNAAGTNTPNRSLKELSFEKYRELVETNLTGAYICVQAFLPRMRERKSGTIINIVSEAGKAASPKSGPAYVISKFGMAGLNQSINAEEKQNGIRACAVFPGDIDTPLLEKRPVPPPPDARKRMLQSEDVAECAWLAINLPPRAVVEEILIRPGPTS
ncbi:MAG TPA: SDR family oxidoreductase [Candidatus Binatia bacterium]|nr:SDR family oxidoreductase [Candidatus Binatia bacterium]